MDNTEKIKEIYQEFEEKLNVLRHERDQVLEEYLNELERSKIEELKNKLQ